MTSKLRVLVIDDQAQRHASIVEAIEAAGDQVVARVEDASLDLPEVVRAVKPDVVIIDVESPGRDLLEDMRRITHEEERPIVMFVDEARPDSIRHALQAGVASYVVKGATTERVRSVIDVAIARFAAERALRKQLAEARSSLEERKLVDRAKGLLMERRGLSEPEAYQRLRKTAMDRGERLGDVARRLIEIADLL